MKTTNLLTLLEPGQTDAINRVADLVATHQGQALLVGGYVRDSILGLSSKDIDIEVFGVPQQELEKLLEEHFVVNSVGKSFGVLKLSEYDIDISIPRREAKKGTGHKGFEIESDPNMSLADAALRRDFTLNAIYYDPLKEETIDPHGGLPDLENRYLRHTSSQFSEDPLRVLRAMQFIARFDLEIAPETLVLCQEIKPEKLPKERLFEEWSKLIRKGVKPSKGLTFLKDCGWIRYYPEIEALIGCEQDAEWHPEGDAWVHTLHCLDAFAQKRLNDDWEDLVVGLAVLCHDIGKPVTTFTDTDGRIKSPGHESAGKPLTLSFLEHITEHKELIESIVPLVVTHLRPVMLYNQKAGDSAIRRLARQVVRIDRLIRVCEADMAGRPPKSADFPAGVWLLEKATELAVKDSAPQPIVMGRHLIESGLKPGQTFKKLLEHCYEAQLDGDFSDWKSGIQLLKDQKLWPES